MIRCPNCGRTFKQWPVFACCPETEYRPKWEREAEEQEDQELHDEHGLDSARRDRKP